jgi:hypothetical protein
MLLALLWLVSTTQLVDEQFDIPAAEWRYVDFALNQQTARVRCSFQAATEGAQVKVALVHLDQLADLREGEALPDAVEAGAGTFEAHTTETGQYAVVIDNRANRRPVQVLLRIDLDFGVRPAARYPEPRRQLGAILISFAIFFALVSYSARRLLAAARRN